MTSERRSSLSSSSHSGRRASSSSFQLPPLPASTDSLTAGTSIPAPAASPSPMPPPKDPALPVTPQRKPILRQKSPLSNEAYFSSSASSMPGAFPATPPVPTPNTGMQPAQFTTTAYSATTSPSPDVKNAKRPSSVRNLLSFKALRRGSNNASPESSSFRPASPGTESMASSQPSLNKKKSGSFWRRNSSLGMTFGKEGEEDGSMAARSRMNSDTVAEEPGDGRSPTPAPGSDFPTVQKRKSGTFWRRKSSLGMGAVLTENGNATTNGASDLNTNGYHTVMDRGRGENPIMNGRENEMSPTDDQFALSKFESVRSISPPPQLPDFIGGGGGLGLGGEDMFKDIH